MTGESHPSPVIFSLPNSLLLFLVAALTESLKQPDAGSQPPTRRAWDARATWPNRLQGTVPFLSADLDFPDPIQLDLLATGDFISQHFEVTLDRFADQFLGERPFLAGDQCDSVGVFHPFFSLKVKSVSQFVTCDS